MVIIHRPIGFDMEWRVFYTRSSSGPVKVTTCRTATVQVCDERMILVIQVHRMQRRFHAPSPQHHNVDIYERRISTEIEGDYMYVLSAQGSVFIAARNSSNPRQLSRWGRIS